MNDRRIVGATHRLAALGALHAAVVLFGFAGLFGKWLALPPVTIVFGRSMIAAVALALLRGLAGERAAAPASAFEWRLAGGGAVLALHWVAFFQAIQTSSVAIGLLGFASFPLFVLVLEAAARQRALRGQDWLIAALVGTGLALLAPEMRIENPTVQGLLWGILSGFTFALLAVANRALSARHSASAIALWQNGCAAALLIPLAVAARAIPDGRAIALLLVLGVACTALAHTLFIRSLRSVTAHTASVVAALEPVYGIVLAFLLLGERPSLRTLAGAALIVGAAIHASRRATPEAHAS
jgi:drug/metabolite transporter (DMT)-like permease